MAQVDQTQPLEVHVNPRKWTTKVNIAVAIAVAVVFLAGAVYGIYMALNPEEAHEEVLPNVDPTSERQ